ncbi:MAG: hypothetical protein RJB57_955 [Actinomycetota bacterium]
MRETAWAIVGWLFAIGASRRARNVIIDAQASGAAWFHGLLHRSPSFVPVSALVGSLTAWGMARTFTGEAATFAFVVFTTNLLQQLLVDVDTHLLPRGRSRGATFFGLVLLGVASLAQSAPARWWWGVLGSFLCWLVFRVIQAVSRGDLGGGDVTLALLIGLHLGWVAIGNVAVFVVVTFVLGGVAGLFTLVRRRSLRRHIAFGPWMVAAAVLTVVWEQQLRGLLGG